MLDAAINIWGKPGEAVISNGQLFIWDQQTPAFVDSGIPATSGERVAVSNGKSLWAAYSEVSGHQELAAVVLSTGEVVGAQGGLVKQGDQILRFNGEAKELEQIDLLAGVIGEYVDSTWTAEQQADGALVVADAIGPRWEYTTNEGWRPVPDFVIRYTPDEIRNVFASEDELKTHMPYLNEQILKDWEGGYNGRVNYGAAGQNFDTLKDGRLQLSLRLPYSPENTLVAKVSNTFYLGVPVRLGPRWGYDNIDYVNTVLWVRSEVSYGTGIEETLDWWQKMDELVTTGDRSIIVRAGLRVQPETVERDLLYDLFIELGRPITALTGDWIEKALALGNWLFDGFAFAYYL